MTNREKTALFVAPSPDWTRGQTISAFAVTREIVLFRKNDGSYARVDGKARYRATLALGDGRFFWAVVEDGDD